MIQANRCRTLWQSVQRNLECRAETSAKALGFNSAMVKIDEAFGNGEPEAEAAELSAYRRVSLLKWLKQGSQPLRLNSNPSVGNFKMKTCSFIISISSVNSGGSFSALSWRYVAAAKAGVSGVRSSWLSAARKSSFALLAFCAAIFSASNSRLRI